MHSTTLSTAVRADQKHSPMLTGFLGLNTTPSARMDIQGTTRAGISNLDPYLHSYIGIQIADPLYVQFRQSAETSNLLKNSKHLSPGVDLKLRLRKESAHMPQIALGIQSALGHQRQAGEFIALSKRYNNFDVTAGVGWGRYATAGHFDNPLKIVSTHFESPRELNSEKAGTPENWFTGDKIGVFAGIEYFLPIKGLSLKLDYGSDHYTFEAQDNTYNAPSPWGLGISYTPKKWINAGFGIQGNDKITGRITVKANAKKWKYITSKQTQPFITEQGMRHTLNLNAPTQHDTEKNLGLNQLFTQNKTVFVTVNIPENISTPQHIQRTIEYIENNYPNKLKDIKEYAFKLQKQNLQGTTLKFSRSQYLKAIKNKSSPQEIWFNTINTADKQIIAPQAEFLPIKGLRDQKIFTTTLQNELSLSEKNAGLLYRSSLLFGAKNLPLLSQTLNAATFRLNIADNLDQKDQKTSIFKKPAHSNIAEFSNERISLENAYIGFATNLKPKIHMLFLLGYLEELYAATGGEILYRSPNSRLSAGAELWYAAKRDPETPLNIGLTRTTTFTGFANLWYDMKNHNVTANMKLGKFLAGDTGIELGLQKKFKNGAKLSTAVRLSNTPEPDLFGNDLNAFHTINISLPFGVQTQHFASANIKTKISPLARDTAQILNKPLSLYDLTEPFSIDHIAENWNDIIPEK